LSVLEAAAAAFYILVLFLGTFLTIFGLPGTVLIALAAFLFAVCTWFHTIGIGTVISLVVISVVAEAGDLGLRLIGVRPFAVSARSIGAAVTGALLGFAAVSAALRGPGAFIGVVLGGIAGLLAVHLAGELKRKPHLRMSTAALFASTATVLGKGLIAAVMSFIALMALYS
jgi:hypothetical protein